MGGHGAIKLEYPEKTLVIFLHVCSQGIPQFKASTQEMFLLTGSAENLTLSPYNHIHSFELVFVTDLHTTVGIVDQDIKLPLLLLGNTIKQRFDIVIFAVITLHWDAVASLGLHLVGQIGEHLYNTQYVSSLRRL